MDPHQVIAVASVPTPIGELAVASGPDGVVAVEFDATREELATRTGGTPVATSPAAEALRAYFAGALGALETLAVAPAGTAFQRQVWTALRKIRVGTTVSYLELARRIGRPTAVRAVGAANGENPIAVVVPCHRVIGANGSLVGYGGGIERKRWLLRHEGALLL
jgi:methylated-DNA-[protein]-cysteine S-methyltransferase